LLHFLLAFPGSSHISIFLTYTEQPTPESSFVVQEISGQKGFEKSLEKSRPKTFLKNNGQKIFEKKNVQNKFENNG